MKCVLRLGTRKFSEMKHLQTDSFVASQDISEAERITLTSLGAALASSWYYTESVPAQADGRQQAPRNTVERGQLPTVNTAL